VAIVSDERRLEYIEAVYLTGIHEIQGHIQRGSTRGVEHMFLHTMTPISRSSTCSQNTARTGSRMQ